MTLGNLSRTVIRKITRGETRRVVWRINLNLETAFTENPAVNAFALPAVNLFG